VSDAIPLVSLGDFLFKLFLIHKSRGELGKKLITFSDCNAHGFSVCSPFVFQTNILNNISGEWMRREMMKKGSFDFE
jgi:hypothetical protein